MAERFRKSGREKLVLLLLSDFDPDGENIAQSFARSLRDDFSLANIQAHKVALTAQQVEELELPPQMQAKAGASTYQRFVAQHGTAVFELEAVPPAELQRLLRAAIDAVLDVAAFNAELSAERQDAAFLEDVRRRVQRALGELAIGTDPS